MDSAAALPAPRAADRSGSGQAESGAFALGPVVHGHGADEASRVLAGVAMRPLVGRWLTLEFRPAEAAAGLALELGHDSGRWPALRVAVQPCARAGAAGKERPGAAAMAAVALVFVVDASATLRLGGAAAALARVRRVALSIAGEPPAGIEPPPAVRAAAALHRLGVVALREIAFTDDARWPLRATGDDPQLRFQRLPGDGRLGLQIALAREDDGLPPPLVYWAPAGRAFRAEACTPLRPAGSDAWALQLPRMAAGTRWRLDPLDREGRFRVDAAVVRVDAALDPARQRWRQLAGLLHRVRLQHGPDGLLPVHDLVLLDARRRRYYASGHDPQLRLRAPLARGWYMLELALDLPGARAQARIYLDHGQGDSEASSLGLPLRSGQVGKRLLYLGGPARLRLDPMTVRGVFGLRHFRLARVTESFACTRMRRKLEAARTRRGAVPADPPAPRLDTPQALWSHYARLFERAETQGIDYAGWIEEVEQPALASAAAQAAEAAGWSFRPVFSVVVPVHETPEPWLRDCLASVRRQTYPHWELCVADDASAAPHVAAVLDEAAADRRVRIVRRTERGHVCAASNSALALARGDFVVLLDHDDLLAPHALHALARALQSRPGALIVYSDEDKLDESGDRCDPYFKPAWSPDLLGSQNYVSHLGAYRRTLVEQVGGFRPGFEGSQDYDLLLRCASRVADPRDVLHVPQVLYHWRKSPGSTASSHAAKDYASAAARRALQAHFGARAPGAQVDIIGPGRYRVRWPLPDPPPLVSLIVPTRDGLDVLRKCIESIVERTTYPTYEILVVDNQSSDPAALAYLDELPARSGGRVRVLRHDAPFNFSAINNAAAAQARGSVLGLINNDIEVISPGWLDEMVGQALRPEIGCVGAKLYYPDDTVQHGGVVLGIGGVAGHAHKHFPRDAEGYFSRLQVVHNVSAVTGAALVVRKSVFDEVGGLDAEHLVVAFNDVDLCLKVQAAGYRNLWTPFAELYHHESRTRGADVRPEAAARHDREARVMVARWGARLKADPYYSPNLTLEREDFSLGDAHPAHRVDARSAPPSRAAAAGVPNDGPEARTPAP